VINAKRVLANSNGDWNTMAVACSMFTNDRTIEWMILPELIS